MSVWNVVCAVFGAVGVIVGLAAYIAAFHYSERLSTDEGALLAGGGAMMAAIGGGLLLTNIGLGLAS